MIVVRQTTENNQFIARVTGNNQYNVIVLDEQDQMRVRRNQNSSAIIKVSNENGTLVPEQTSGVTIVSSGVLDDTINRLDQLADVVEGVSPQDNATLVYDAATDKYVVQPMMLDGGAF